MKCIDCRGFVAGKVCTVCGLNQEDYMLNNINYLSFNEIIRFIFLSGIYSFNSNEISEVLSKFLINHQKEKKAFNYIYSDNLIKEIQSIKSIRKTKIFIKDKQSYFSDNYGLDKKLVSKLLEILIGYFSYEKRIKRISIKTKIALFIILIIAITFVMIPIRVPDSNSDLVSREINNNGKTVLKLEETPQVYIESMQKHIIVKSDGVIKKIKLFDVEDDSDLDIVSINYDNSDITIYKNTSKGFVTDIIENQTPLEVNKNINREVFYSNSISIASEDEVSYLYSSYNNKTMSMVVDDGGNFDFYSIVDGNGFQASTLVDMDGDSDLDIIAHTTFNEIIYYENNNYKFTPHILGKSFINILELKCVDIDNDGDLDVLGSSWANQSIFWYENENSVFTLRIVATNTSDIYRVYPIDIDNDKDFDIVAADKIKRTIRIFYNNQGEFEEGSIGVTKSIIQAIMPIDYDEDLDVDILVATQDSIILFEFNDNLYEPKVLVENTYKINSIDSVDIDGDGDLDIITTDKTGEIVWYGDFHYSLTLLDYDNSEVTVEKLKIDCKIENVIELEREGYSFIGWTDGLNTYSKDFKDFFMPNRDVLLVAVYE